MMKRHYDDRSGQDIGSLADAVAARCDAHRTGVRIAPRGFGIDGMLHFKKGISANGAVS